MTTQRDLRSEVESYARQVGRALDYNHDFEHHAQFVARDAEYIARQEGADPDICWTAGMLHDVGLTEGRDEHQVRSAACAGIFLIEHGASEEVARAVSFAIEDNDHDRIAHGSLEAKCLYDADNLQTVGPFGFARVYADMLCVLDQLPRHEAMRRLPSYQQRQLTRFQTCTGRSLAEPLQEFMTKFYQLYEAFEQGA